MAVVGFTRQALGPDVVAHAAAVVDLGQLEAAKADALLFRGYGGFLAFLRFDLHVRGAPIGGPVFPLRRQRFIQRYLSAGG